MHKISQSAIVQVYLKHFSFNRQEVNMRTYDNFIPSKNLVFGIQYYLDYI